MTQSLQMARELEPFARAITTVEWLRDSVDVVFVDSTRIDSRFISSLRALGRTWGFDVEVLYDSEPKSLFGRQA